MYNSNLRTSALGIQLIQGYEKCRLTAYQDSGGIWTIAYGSTRYLDGRKVKDGDTITQDEADKLFALTLPKFEDLVRSKIKRDLKPCEFDAAVSFCFNAGTSYKSGTQWRDYNIWTNITNGLTGDEMTAYWTKLAVTVGGVVSNGLIRRRKSEVHLYLTGELCWYE